MGIFGSKPKPESMGTLNLTPTLDEGETSGGFFSGSTAKYVVAVLGGALLLYLALAIYNWMRKRQGLEPVGIFKTEGSGDVTPAPVDGKTKLTIAASELPSSGAGDNGIQFWMFIKDWDYRFGQTKDVLKRVSATDANIVGPRITLSPSENTLDVAVSLFPSGGETAATPDVENSADMQVCSVENVPLQSWFSVSVTTFQRNLDIYINGRLVKSCVLRGVPRVAMGDIVVADNGGFSGSVCNVNAYAKMIGPGEAQSYYAKGTNCQEPASAGTPVDKDSLFITLFGYTFRFSTFNKDGKELSSYTF
jgi:hypothetical protein